MAIGPNDEVMVIASEVTRLEREFDKAIAPRLKLAPEDGGIFLHISTQMPPKELLSKIGAELQARYVDSGWGEAVLLRRDDSSLSLRLYKCQEDVSGC